MKKTILIIIVSFVALAAGFGCAALSEYVTPAIVDQRAVDYAFKAGVSDPYSYEGYQNLEKALRLESDVQSAHEINQLAYQQMSEQDQLEYAQLNDVVVRNRTAALQREELLFGPEGILTLGLSMAGFGTLTGLIGLMRKRPGDLTPQDVEGALTEINGELDEKDRQLIELVKGVQAFIDANGKDEKIIAQLKNILGLAQSQETKTKVAEIKSTL